MNIGLLILFFVCHWMADYTHLSTNWMLSAKRFGKPLFPILCHALMHGCLMGLVMVFVVAQPNIKCFHVFIFQVVTHFAIDVLKGRLNGWFPSLQNPANKFHWWVFGGDQFLHQFVIILMGWYLS